VGSAAGVAAASAAWAPAAQARTIRPGLDPDDVLLIMGFLWRIDPKSDWRSRSGRLLDILTDGLKAGAPDAAPRLPSLPIAPGRSGSSVPLLIAGRLVVCGYLGTMVPRVLRGLG
jgi:hypothetical protein